MIRVWRGELSDALTEGLVRPVSGFGEAVSAAGRRLELKAGDELSTRMHDLGEMPVGGAVLTPGGNLQATFVIHVVVQSVEEEVSPWGVRRAIENGFWRAADWGLESVAVPPIGLGPGNLEPEQCARILVEVARQHLRSGSQPHEVTIVVENGYEEDLYHRLVSLTEGANGGG